MKRKWYEWILTIAFFAMAALCVIWDRNEGFVTLAINAALFLIGKEPGIYSMSDLLGD